LDLANAGAVMCHDRVNDEDVSERLQRVIDDAKQGNFLKEGIPEMGATRVCLCRHHHYSTTNRQRKGGL